MREVYRNISLRPASDRDIDYVLRRLMPEHVAEIMPLRFDASIDSVITDLQSMRAVELELQAVFYKQRSSPIALLGLWLNTPKTALVGLMATHDVHLIIKDLTRYIRGEFMPRWRRSGRLRRVEVRALAGWKQCCRWIDLLRPDEAHLCQNHGKDGEDFIQYAWIAGEN